MANYSYLCATNAEQTYPSFTDSSYDPGKQTIACDVYCIPLLWMGLFRPNDIVTRTFDVDEEDEEVYTEAPIVTRDRAITQLREAVPVLNRMFAREGSLDEYADLLAEAVAGVDFQFVTIEMEEIAGLCEDERAYYDQFRSALASFDSPDDGAYERFRDISQLRPGAFPPARMYLDHTYDASDDDRWNFCRIVGAEHFRPVPWERGPC